MCKGFDQLLICIVWGDEESTIMSTFLCNMSTYSHIIMSDKTMKKKAGAKSCLYLLALLHDKRT